MRSRHRAESGSTRRACGTFGRRKLHSQEGWQTSLRCVSHRYPPLLLGVQGRTHALSWPSPQEPCGWVSASALPSSWSTDPSVTDSHLVLHGSRSSSGQACSWAMSGLEGDAVGLGLAGLWRIFRSNRAQRVQGGCFQGQQQAICRTAFLLPLILHFLFSFTGLFSSSSSPPPSFLSHTPLSLSLFLSMLSNDSRYGSQSPTCWGENAQHSAVCMLCC